MILRIATGDENVYSRPPEGWVVTDAKDPPLKAEAFFPLLRRDFQRRSSWNIRKGF